MLNYLTSIRNYLKLDPVTEDDFMREIRGHLEDRIREFKEAGFSEEESKKNAARLLGSSKVLARQIYEVYSQGSWKQALFAALPHFLIAALFAMELWYDNLWLIGLIVAAIGAVIYGWVRSKPVWLFPWLGYLLIPVVVAGIFIISLPIDKIWFVAIAYVPVLAFIVIALAAQVIRRDWLFVSLMLLPVPIVLGWLIALTAGGSLSSQTQIIEAAPWIALSFAVLALSVAVFIRVRQRWAKVLALLGPELLIITLVALDSRNALGFIGWLVLTLLALLSMLVPALLEPKVRKKMPVEL